MGLCTALCTPGQDHYVIAAYAALATGGNN